ncbi:MAG: radical SAM protein [Nitrospirae bacterium]|nr:radical SAM protein [Nitrospirota bacterium]
MDCPETVFTDNTNYLRDFTARSARLRVPLSGSLDLTHRCNLRCLHCYTGDRSGDMPIAEMDTGRILSLLDEICDAGCLYLLLTGGEPLLREDFPEIYRYAKEKGFLITVFTNGTLITDKIGTLFEELPPRTVEISLYGATAPTYEKITGVKGSYRQCLSGIRKLLEQKINVRLKTILMAPNRHEFFAIEGMAKDFGVKFRFDAAIFPRLNGDPSPVNLRVSPEEAVDKEFSDHERVALWEASLKNYRHGSATDDLYHCGAGVTGFHIDPCGSLRPCLMATTLSYDLQKGGFSPGWEAITSRSREKKADRDFTCNTCDKKLLCGYCPAFFELENRDAQVRSEYLCAMGNTRSRQLQHINTKGARHG